MRFHPPFSFWSQATLAVPCLPMWHLQLWQPKMTWLRLTNISHPSRYFWRWCSYIFLFVRWDMQVLWKIALPWNNEFIFDTTRVDGLVSWNVFSGTHPPQCHGFGNISGVSYEGMLCPFLIHYTTAGNLLGEKVAASGKGGAPLRKVSWTHWTMDDHDIYDIYHSGFLPAHSKSGKYRFIRIP